MIAVAGGLGIGLGIGLSELTGDDSSPPEASTPAATTAQPATSTRRGNGQGPLNQVRVTVRSAVLQRAVTPSGQARNRARLSVRVSVRNQGTQRVVTERPSLLAARQRIPTNAAADASGTRLAPIDGGTTQNVTLKFETAGAVTEQLATQRQARVIIAGRSWPVTITIGPPAGASAQPAATVP